MRAFLIDKYAHPSNIPLTLDAPEPKAAPDQVLVDVYSAGLNFFDILQAQGKYQNQPPFPFVLGSELAGKISADSPIPPGCPFKPGDRVFGAAQGTFAEKVAAKWELLSPLPSNISFDQGGGLQITWPTSYEALVGHAELKPGEWLLVLASAGGVGTSAVQLGKALGAKVIAAASSQEKLDIAVKYGGADHAVDYSKPDWQKEVLKITGGKGVNVVYDPVGMIRDSLKCAAWKCRLIVIGFAGGKIESLPLNLVLLKGVSIVGAFWGGTTVRAKERIPVVMDALLDLLASERIKPVVYPDVFPLERLADGLYALEKRKTWGKVIVRIRDEEPLKAKL